MVSGLPVRLVGSDQSVQCVDGSERPYLSLDAAASTSALPAVATRVNEFLPSYSSVHRGAGYKSQISTAAYEEAREAALGFAGREGRDDVAIICRNTTEAINHLVYRLRLEPDATILMTVAEHHANLLPWTRIDVHRRYVECGVSGMFSLGDVINALDSKPTPRLLTITGASNVTGWMPPIDEIIEAAHTRGIAVVVDAAQLAPHRPLPATADYIAWSGHKMYAPYGAGVLIGPRESFVEGDPFLAGGGAVDLVDLDEVMWTDPPEREEAGSPNVIGAVALGAAIAELQSYGWDDIVAHEQQLATRLRSGLAAMRGVHLLGPALDVPTLAVATFEIDSVPHALVAARLSAEFGIGVRHGCFCAHPYLMRLLDLPRDVVDRYREDVRIGDRRRIPGAVRASGDLSTTPDDIDRFLAAVAVVADGSPAPVVYRQDAATGDYWPEGDAVPWATGNRSLGASCSRG